METNVARDQDRELWGLLRQAAHAVDRAREDELRHTGVSMVQAAILYIVKIVEGPVTPAKISRWLLREPHSVSGLLNRMEKQGLVKKVKDLERKNVIRVALTQKGEEAYRQSSEGKVVHNILSCLSAEERDNLRAYLGRLRNKALQEHRPRSRWSFV